MGLIQEKMRAAVGEAKQFTLEHNKRLWQNLSEEFKEELVTRDISARDALKSLRARRMAARVLWSWKLAKTIVREELVAAQDLPVSDQQLCGVTLRGPRDVYDHSGWR
ncbi:hypothetical protein E2C01_100038 [Portunus trituberculatus]|uniref:Uncharacterized protein n=1 Tax=Portunus trituberculatus TaxID=210409 RepID=A0A5B7KCH5_PORTR|nr:hypothetical protein [Portunus trituberculatus]